MNKYVKHLSKSLFLGLFLMTGLSACDSAVSDQDGDLELAQLSSTISDEITLSADQQNDFEASLARHGGDRRNREAGYLWQVAADAQASWTDEQKAELFEGTDDMESGFSFRGLLGHPGSGGFYGLGGFVGGSRRHGISPDDDVLNLTEEQEAAFETLHTTYREAFKALATSFQSEEITADEFIAQMVALREDKAAAIADLLTDDQEAALEEYRTTRQADFAAFRAEVHAVRNDVLGLSDDQAAAIDALYAEQMETRESLIEQLQAGSISVADIQAEIEALETARQEVMVGLLDDTQYEIVQIHDALSVRSGRFGHRGGRGGFGKGEGKGHTFTG